MNLQLPHLMAHDIFYYLIKTIMIKVFKRVERSYHLIVLIIHLLAHPFHT